MGHLGADRKQEEIKYFTSNTCRCIQQKKPQGPPKAPMERITKTTPFVMVSIDFLPLEKSQQRFEYILLIVNFTRFAQAYPTQKKDSMNSG